MKSVGQAKKALPSAYIDTLYRQFPPHVADTILRGHSAGRAVTLRVNVLKTDTRSLMRELQQNGVKFERVPWYTDGLVIQNKTERYLESLACYKEGRIYLQSLSSMIPPLLLKPSPGQSVLDLTAAPGSKTTQTAALMNNQGSITAIEIDEIRYKRLCHNIAQQEAIMVQGVHANGALFGRHHPNSFDCVLLDAPCSGEGLFLVEKPATSRHWKLSLRTKMARQQRQLFRSAFTALKPGGRLVYSTCTLAPEENEAIVAWALGRWPKQLQVAKIALPLPSNIRMSGLNKVSRNAVRILPSHLMEGFFCCVFVKSSMEKTAN